MRENNRKPIEKCIKKLPQFTTMNVIDGQAGLVIYSSLIFYSLTIYNILNIVVLLILAAVSISMLGGENGIITQAQNAKLESRAGEVEEKVNLWKSEKISSKYTNATVKTEDELLEEMKTDKILFEEEIDRENKLITIGTREISYKIYENGEIGDIPLEPDTGKEELILEYTVGAGDTIELPYDLVWYEPIEDQEYPATFDFQVDWGDGTIVTGINNSNIETAEKSKHQYTNAGIYEVQIKGKYEVLSNYDSANGTDRLGYDKLTKVKQWGTTGLKNVILGDSTNLLEIVTPTKGSFKELTASYFGSCTSLTSIPDKLFANCSNVQSFQGCFEECSNLTTIGDYAFANCTNVQGFEGCLYNCINLTTIGNYAFANCTNVQSFEECFYNCTNLRTIGDYAFANCEKIQSFEYCFSRCENLTTIGDYVFANCTNVQSFEGCFGGCLNLTTIGNYAFTNCTNVQNFKESFYGCTSLTSIPENLFENCTNVQSFKECFSKCINLTGNAPKLWFRVPNGEQNGYVGIPDGFGCFTYCEELDNYNQIPGYWKDALD